MAAPEGDRDRALNSAIQALARRDHSARSIRAKLEQAGLSGQAQDDAVDTLARAGYLDDDRFAQGRADVLARRGYGDAWIRADLDRQGVEEESIERALGTLDSERARAVRLVGESPGDPRALRTLQRKGFSEETVEAAAAGRLRTDAVQE